MTEPSVQNDEVDAQELARLKDENAALKAHNEALTRESQELAAKPGHSGVGRSAIVAIGVILAALLISVSVPAVWMNRMLTDTDWYVRTVAPLAQNADVQNAVATSASNAVIKRLDAQNRVKEVLPPALQFLAAPVGSAVDDMVRKQATALVRSEQFAQLWVTVNRASHKLLVAAVTGKDTGVVGVEAGTITLDVSALADAVKSKLEAAGLGFASAIPTGGLNSNLVLYQSPVLAQMTTIINGVTQVAFWLPLIALALGAGAIALATDRRRAVLWLGAGITIAGLLPLEAIYLGQFYATQKVVELLAIPSTAVQAAYEIIFRDLISADQLLTLVGAVVWIGAVLVGPAGWAVSMRTGLSGGLSGVASHLELGRFGEWVAARRKGLRLAGIPIVFVVLLAMPAPRTVTQVVWLIVVLLVWVFAVELVGASGTSAPTATNDEESPDDASATDA